MNDEPQPALEPAPPKTPILDIGAGDREAPANAIPNIIADLVETETWRNAAAVLTGALLIGLGYWAYNGIRDAIAETRVASLEALLGTVVTGLDVWVGEHRTEAVRLAKDPARCGQRLRSGTFRQRLDLGIDGTPQFVRPYPDPELSVKGSFEERRFVAWFLAPIREGDGPATAALAMGVEADRVLATIFSAARPGNTSEAYAFSDEFIHRFEREVQIASQLLHPNTALIYDFGRTREGQPYYVMEYLDGVTLAELVAHSGHVPAGRVIHILRQVGAALREAHQHGMIHRDVKPENVMLCRRGEDDVVKLLDFGLVKNLERAQTRDITKQLKILGTPRYMAPERILNPADVDGRSDIYALGAVGYFLLTGKPIFEGDNNLEITNQVLHAAAPRAAASGVPGIPEGLDELVAACLEKDRAQRPQSVDAVIEALDRLSSRLAWTNADAETWWAGYRESCAVEPPGPAARPG